MTRLPAAATLAAAVTLALVAVPAPVMADREPPPKEPTAVGRGGAVATVDPYATKIGLRVLRRGGNAVDAAVAAAAALGVTEPYSAGIGGGGFFMHYDGETGEVRTIDGRETAPGDMPRDAFVDPDTGEPYPFFPDLVTSGVSVGVPGTLATWQRALQRWGTRDLAASLRPAARLARRGFEVDRTFRQQTRDNRERLAAFTSSRRLFLPDGELPELGSTFRNRDLAATYRLLAQRGLRPFYRGRLAGDIVRAVRRPPTTRGTDLPVPPGFMRRSDLRRYRVLHRPATESTYRGYTVHGMRSSSSGGTTVGEALNILENFDMTGASDVDAQHRYLEATALAFADRGEYFGDERFVDVPVEALLDDEYGAERACRIRPDEALDKPTAPGDVTSYDGDCDAERAPAAEEHEGLSTTNLTVADRWGDVVEYTLTIEQTGGSGLVVPGRGFLLNNELTDFSLEFEKGDPNRIQPYKRPRSSMSPAIVLDRGEPFLALGSPGGATIITTVLQLLVHRIDRGLTIEEAMAAPRAAPLNIPRVPAEPEYLDRYRAALKAYGHHFVKLPELGAATAIELGPGGLMTAVAEPERRGGGAAAVVDPVPRR